MSLSCCMCDPVETAQSLWRGHKWWSHGPSERESTGVHRIVWFLVSVGCELDPSTGARHKDVGKSESKTTTNCEIEHLDVKTQNTGKKNTLQHETNPILYNVIECKAIDDRFATIFLMNNCQDSAVARSGEKRCFFFFEKLQDLPFRKRDSHKVREPRFCDSATLRLRLEQSCCWWRNTQPHMCQPAETRQSLGNDSHSVVKERR